MDKYITGVAYRHTLLTAYLKVVGRTLPEATFQAKKVGTVLLKTLPEQAAVGVPRYRGYDPEADLEHYEIPIIIAACEGRAKAKLAELVLRGAA